MDGRKGGRTDRQTEVIREEKGRGNLEEKEMSPI